ncbi:hypothetical protein GCM10023214_77410 [Amycolatopsis dongchuanensis]|uniref:Uncharacterized protein n=1 Tax=Amycolatopsis dongchuanensis TaxID=1070866 RepID=A0ABP8VT54_9PSEU
MDPVRPAPTPAANRNSSARGSKLTTRHYLRRTGRERRWEAEGRRGSREVRAVVGGAGRLGRRVGSGAVGSVVAGFAGGRAVGAESAETAGVWAGSQAGSAVGRLGPGCGDG